MAEDIRTALSKIAEMEFAGVEAAFLPEGVSIEDAGKLYKEFNLNVFAAHIELPDTQSKKDELLRIADAYECKKMIWHGWPEDTRYKTPEGISQLIDIYHEANEFIRSNGLEFGIHNHWWEYEKQEAGRFPFEILLEKLDSAIFFEIDTYWATVAGHDPGNIIRKFGKRAPLLHIKDGPASYTDNLDADQPDPMVPLGQGNIDIPGIAEAAKETVEWMIIELDLVETDVFKAIKASYDYLTRNQFAQGIS
jgi:sugar phosphate isomerase/epimerase